MAVSDLARSLNTVEWQVLCQTPPCHGRISELTCKHLIVSSRILMPLGDVLDSPQAKRAVTSSAFWARLSCTAKLYQISKLAHHGEKSDSLFL